MTLRTVLLADDDAAIRTVISQALSRAGYDIKATGTAAGLWHMVSAGEGDVVITDVVMPDENGLDLIPRIKKLRPTLPVIVMSAQNTLSTAVKATDRGAYEYLPKPFDIKELTHVVGRALAQGSGRDAVVAEPPASEEEEGLPLIGRSPAMQEVYRTMARVVPTDLTVLITGESGTGKELVARALHNLGKRRHNPFVAVNMAAIPKDLIESELFGHEKGAFTGANARMAGRFEQAQGGTLFLDEIGDMPADAQTRLLRVLQEGEYTTVGGRTPIKADVRIIAATHQSLRSLIEQGLFREDLFYRLNVIPVRVPSLRERLDDVPLLVRHFLARAVEEGLPQKSLDNAALDRLRQYAWPGNVRELENLIRRLAALYSEDIITAAIVESELSDVTRPAQDPAAPAEGLSQSIERHLGRYFSAHADDLPPDGLYERILAEVEKPLLSMCLAATHGNQLKAAKLLGLNRNTLRKKLRALRILS